MREAAWGTIIRTNLEIRKIEDSVYFTFPRSLVRNTVITLQGFQ